LCAALLPILGLPASVNSEVGPAVSEAPATPLDEPVFRVRSAVIRRRDFFPPEEVSRQVEQRSSAVELENWRRSYPQDYISISALLLNKLIAVFCEQAPCAPDPKDVADWQSFLDTLERGRQMGLHGSNSPTREMNEKFFGDEPARWQRHKALYERYGGRVVNLNLSGWEPVEAYLRLIHDMEDHGALEFFDQQVRADVLEHLGRFMESAFEVDESFRQREGKQHPWESPWWKFPSLEEIRKQVEAVQPNNE
jgi:hypothetical protein